MSDLPQQITPGVYRHYKGELYLVIGVARHANTEERGVVYMPLSPHAGKLPMLSYRPVDGEEGFFTPVEGQSRFSLVYATNTTQLEQQNAKNPAE